MNKIMINKNKSFFVKIILMLVLVLTISISYNITKDYIINNLIYATYEMTPPAKNDTRVVDNITYSLVRTPQQLAYAVSHSGDYMLANNIDISSDQWITSSGDRKFSGHFDGNNYIISGLTITNPYRTRVDCIGLFGLLDAETTIKNVWLTNVNITSTTSCSGNYVGGLIGRIGNYVVTTITNCHVSGKIDINSDRGIYAGGIVGSANMGSAKINISYCFNEIRITAKTNNGYEVYLGGIIANIYNSNKNSSIFLCSNSGSIDSTFYGNYASICYTGGIVGYCNLPISKCCNTATIYAGHGSKTNTSYCGGIAGCTINEVQNCYNKGSINAFAKTSASTYDLSYNNTDQEVHSEFPKVITVFYNQWKDIYWYYAQGPKNNNTKSIQRVKNVVPAYAGGIVGNTTSSVSNSYNTGTIQGGETSYSDTYAFTLSYYQYYHTLSLPCIYTYYYEIHVKIYYVTLNYTYEYLYGPVVGAYNMSNGGNYNNVYGTTSKKTTDTYTYRIETYANQTQKFEFYNLSIISAINLLTKPSTSMTYTDSSLKSDFMYNTYDLDTYLFPDDKISYVNVKNSVSSSNVSIKAIFKADGSKKEYTLGSTELNQGTPNGFSTNSSMTSSSFASKLGSAWLQNSNVNEGHPYLKDMYW